MPTKLTVFLRPDDYRCDAEFKSELADKFIDMGKIDLIFDDRQKVVDMREIKFYCSSSRRRDFNKICSIF